MYRLLAIANRFLTMSSVQKVFSTHCLGDFFICCKLSSVVIDYSRLFWAFFVTGGLLQNIVCFVFQLLFILNRQC